MSPAQHFICEAFGDEPRAFSCGFGEAPQRYVGVRIVSTDPALHNADSEWPLGKQGYASVRIQNLVDDRIRTRRVQQHREAISKEVNAILQPKYFRHNFWQVPEET